MSDRTPRFALPYILPGQAQKETFHNEALVLVDLALHPAVAGEPVAVPPTDPAEGECWAIAAGAEDAFAGRDGGVAMCTGSGWRFAAARQGMSVWNQAAGLAIRWDGSGWTGGEVDCSALRVGGLKVVGERLPAPPSPSGGTIIDLEARAAVDALIATLKSHGLIGL